MFNERAQCTNMVSDTMSSPDFFTISSDELHFQTCLKEYDSMMIDGQLTKLSIVVQYCTPHQRDHCLTLLPHPARQPCQPLPTTQFHRLSKTLSMEVGP